MTQKIVIYTTRISGLILRCKRRCSPTHRDFLEELFGAGLFDGDRLELPPELDRLPELEPELLELELELDEPERERLPDDDSLQTHAAKLHEPIRQHGAVFQLGIFTRALRPARTGLHSARFTSALPELLKKNFFFFFPFTKCNCCCVFRQPMQKCLCLQICAHVFIDRLQNCAQTSFRSRAGL